MVLQAKLTIEEFEAFAEAQDDRRFELINGEVIEKVPTELHGIITFLICGAFYTFLSVHPIGRVSVEPRHRIENDEENSRLPDIAYTSNERALPIVERGSVPQMPDLAIEIKSPSDSIKKLREKAQYYLANGCLMVWLIYPEKRIIEIHQIDEDIQILVVSDTISGGDLLPGFELPVKNIFPQ